MLGVDIIRRTSPAVYTPFTSESQIRVYPINTRFRVYYLEAPLSILSETIGSGFFNDILNINGYHTGLGFQPIGEDDQPITGQSFTMDLIAANGVILSALLPDITTSPDGTKSLEWKNFTQVTIGSRIDQTYWTQSTYITTLSAEDLIRYQRWVLRVWLPKNPLYSLFSASQSNQKGDIFNPIMRACICDTFAFNSLYYMVGDDAGSLLTPVPVTPGLGRNFQNVTLPNVTVAAFVASGDTSIERVDFEKDRESIIDFFVQVDNLINDFFKLSAKVLLSRNMVSQLSNSSNLIRQMEQEVFTAISLLRELYCTFQTTYYYGYDARTNSLEYYKITNPKPYLAYLTTSLQPITVSESVVESTGSKLNGGCSASSPFRPSEGVSNKYAYFIFFVVTIAVIFIAWRFLRGQRK